MRRLRYFWPVWTLAMIAFGVVVLALGSPLWPMTWFFTIPLSLAMTWFVWSRHE